MVNKPVDEASPFLEKQVAFFVGTYPEIPMDRLGSRFQPIFGTKVQIFLMIGWIKSIHLQQKQKMIMLSMKSRFCPS